MEIWLLVQTGTTSDRKPIYGLAHGSPFSSTEEANAYSEKSGFTNTLLSTTLKEA